MNPLISKQRLKRLPALLLASGLLGACAVNPHTERSQLSAPSQMSEVHTQAQLALTLAIKLDAKLPCSDANCGESVGFEDRVNLIGAKLADAAYLKYPELQGRVQTFNFTVVDKAELGTLSTPSGAVGVLRPVSEIAQNDEALSFLLAREIGHVVGRHHEENTATSTVISIVATLLAPVVKVVKVIATVYQGVTPALASASVSAASFASSRLVISSYRPVQREEADVIAMNLLRTAQVDERSAYEGFSRSAMSTIQSSWTRELQESLGRLNGRIAARDLELARAAAEDPRRLKLATELSALPVSASIY